MGTGFDTTNVILRLLRRIRPYVVVIITGMLLWGITWGIYLEDVPVTANDRTVGFIALFITCDVVLGAVAILLLPLSKRYPFTVAILASAFLTLSSSATGAASLMVIRIAFAGNRMRLIAIGAVWGCAVVANSLLLATVTKAGFSWAQMAGSVVLGLLVYVVLLAIGRYWRAREETLRLLRERAHKAEQDREKDIHAAQETERLRIAREMHDVLAHRMSLVSMHAGVLTYREDLPREKITEAAHVIQESTAQALTELRGLLGVLRDANEVEPRSPQPVLEHLPILLAETRAAGARIEVEFIGLEVVNEQPLTPSLSEATSRAAYRIVQEALTNSRKHAPGETVRLRLSRVGEYLGVESRNRLPSEPAEHSQSSGMGLIGLTERIQILGGILRISDTSGEFVIEGKLPWA